MTGLQVFSYETREIRTVQQDGETWWVLRDVCNALDIKKTADIAERLDIDEVGQTDVENLRGQMVKMIIINESGLYNVILRSDKPEAKKFKRWVTHEVLPAIRRDGGYMVPQLSQNEMILQIAQSNVEFEKRLAAMEQRQADGQRQIGAALAAFARPNVDRWKADMDAKLRGVCERYGLSRPNTAGKLYAELEQTANVMIGSRLKRLKKRYRDAGHTYKEAQALSKLDAISKDKGLRAIFEGVVTRFEARYAQEIQ
jgi:prophage antirepressor-like protein